MSLTFRSLVWPVLALVLWIGGAGAQTQSDAKDLKEQGAAVDQKPGTNDKGQKRRVYVLHSGVHTILSDTWKNIAADSIKEGLMKRGVAARDIVALDNPYPTASWRNMFPKECLTMFAASAMPESKVAQECYVRLHKALQAQEVRPQDDLVWVGHSAGGQMGLTMAYLAKNVDKFPDIARETSPYRFDMVIMLGSPVGTNMLSPDIKIRHYYSPQDKVVRWLARYGPIALRTCGYRCGINLMPPNLHADDRIRVFLGIDHPYWDVDCRVLDRIVAEANPAHRPLWQSPVLAPGLEMSLMRLVTQALSEQYQVTFEDPPLR